MKLLCKGTVHLKTCWVSRTVHAALGFLCAAERGLVEEQGHQVALIVLVALLSLKSCASTNHPKYLMLFVCLMLTHLSHVGLYISYILDKLLIHHQYNVTVGFSEIIKQPDYQMVK